MTSVPIFCIIVGTLMIVSLFLMLAWMLFVDNNRRRLSSIRTARIEHRWELCLRDAQLTTREETFGQISAELHDNVCQVLSIAHSVLEGEVASAAAGPLRATSLWCADRVAACLESLRQLSRSLDGGVIHRLGLRPALEEQLSAVRLASGVTCSLDFPPGLPDPGEGASLALYRIIQECLHNTLRHAGAARVFIRFRCPRPGRLEMMFADDGAGIPEGSVVKGPGRGLSAIRERVSHLRGSLLITTAAGQGLTLTITLNIPR